ncbi:MAG: PCMD domain-containing protein [Bacteroidota bacterium]
MKQALLLFIIPILFISGSFAQQIPNGSYETWTGGEPDNWNTTNMNFLGTNFVTVTKDLSNPQQGTASAQLTVVTKSVLFNPVTVQGVLTLGVLDINLITQTASVTGGYPFTGMPQKLAGYFKYQPVNNDACVVGMGLFKRINGVQDTIAFGAVTLSGTFNDWSYFEVPIEYDQWIEPDTMNILILNSIPQDGIDHTGTKMWVDNLSFVYGTVGIEGVTFAKDISIYAERNSSQLILSSTFEKQENLTISLFTMGGIETKSWKRTMQQSTERLDVSAIPPGTYIIRITSGCRLVDTRKITILN